MTDTEYTTPAIDQLLSKQYGQQLVEGEERRSGSIYRIDSRGDAVWFGIVDKWENAVSMIQSIYHEYSAAVVPPEFGILLRNSGSFLAVNRLD